MNQLKKITFMFAITLMIYSCNTEQKSEMAEVTAVPEKMDISMPYMPSYSSSFEMGNPAYATMIVQGSWKDWEDNNLDNMVNWVADTITAFHSNTDVVRGAENLMARWKEHRAGYTSVKPTIDAVIPVYSADKKENWVLVWATEIDTKADGTIDTVSLMESWRINKEGKADLLMQYDRAKRKK
jgi:hypothetical protein